jgi:carboxyl-terminal processing protease
MKRPLALLLTLLLLAACGGGTPTASVATAPALAEVTATPAAGGGVTTPPGTTVAGGAPRTPVATVVTTPGVAGRATAGPTGTARATPPRRADNVTAVPNTSPDAAAALIEQAIGELLENYVDDLRSDVLYRTAYDGAVATLRASGKSPQPQTLNLTGDRRRDSGTFRTAYLALAGAAGPDINQSVLAYEAIGAVVDQIDECHTYFLEPEENRRAKAQNQGQENYTGIGVQINAALRPATIIRVYRGSPAEGAGLREGDQIIAVNGTDVSDLPVDQVSPLVRGPEGSQVRLTVRRPNEPAPRDFTITRATINVPVFFKEVRNGPNGEKIGYMELSSFSAQVTRTGVGDGVEKDIQAALEEFEREGVRYWILDLRNNPGGYVVTLSRVASRFIKDGKPVAYYVRANGDQDPINTDRRSYFTPQRPFAVLINGGSGSSSEAFAAAAQDYGFARTFGQTTSGCLAAGQSFDLADGSAINITVEKVVSPQKREINRVGVAPDEEIVRDPASLADPVYDGAVRWLLTRPQP